MAPQKCRFLRRGGSSAEPTVAVSVETVEALMNTLVAVRENASFLCVELPVFLLLFAQNDAALLFFSRTIFILQNDIIWPRQARDKHRETLQKKDTFSYKNANTLNGEGRLLSVGRALAFRRVCGGGGGSGGRGALPGEERRGADGGGKARGRHRVFLRHLCIKTILFHYYITKTGSGRTCFWKALKQRYTVLYL